MRRITFTDEEIAVLKKEKIHPPFPMNRRRGEVLSLKAQGSPPNELERIVGLSHRTITKGLTLYQPGGFEALTPLKYQGQPSQVPRYADDLKASCEQSPGGTLKEANASISAITGIA